MRTQARWLALYVALLALSVQTVAQSGAKNGEWPTYGGDIGNTRYSPLDQINASNFSRLEIAWRLRTDNFGPRPETSAVLESTPLMVRGVFYATAGTRRAVIAADAATGELLWMHREDEGPRGDASPLGVHSRGVAYWSDGNQERIIYVTPGYRMIALDAKTGNRVPSFGVDGVVDLKQEDDQEIAPLSGEIGLYAAPLVAGNTVIVGSAHGPEYVPATSRTNVKGYVRGFDVRTGRRLWIFHTIPRPGEFGIDTWQQDSWSYTGNTGVWSQISADLELGLVYLGVETPTSDLYGGHRPGEGLFGNSLVAVDLQTGRRKWHYQYVHHDLWDYDNPCPPILADVNINGRVTRIVAQCSKQGFLYVLNRETGEPIWPIVERPVEKGDVPGEWYSPTQPFPTRPPAYDRQGLAVSDLIAFTPALRAEAEGIVKNFKIGPIFTPPVVSKAEGPVATLTLAGAGGAANWPGGSFDPETGIMFVSSQTVAQALSVSPGGPQSDLNYITKHGPAGASVPTTVQGLPLIKPPYGQISAIDLNTGDILWQVPHGETPDNIRNHPALKGINLPRTGRTGQASQLATKTMLVAGEKGTFTLPDGRVGAMLRAYDKATGRELGAVYMPAPQTGGPMTYMLGARQYIVVAVGSRTHGAEFIAFRAPAN